ncbi:MAG: hypothetical protein ACK41U_10820, partial [Paracoccus sp. (in: a-proteobacteria)]
ATEAAEREAEQRRAAEAAEREAEQRRAAEAAEREAEQRRAAEAAEREAEQRRAAEAAEREAEQRRAAEAAEREAEQRRAAEAAEREAEQRRAAEAAEREAEQRRAAEAAEREAEQRRAAEAAEREAEQRRAAEAAEREAEQRRAAEAAEDAQRQALEDALREAQQNDAGAGGTNTASTGETTGGDRQRIEGGDGASAGLDPLAAALAEALSGNGADTPPPPGDAMQLAPSPIRPVPMPDADPGARQSRLPMGEPLSLAERDGLRAAIGQCWNVGMLSVEAAQVTVTVAVTLGPDGRPDPASLRIADFRGGSAGAAQQAFDVARRAIILCGQSGFALPASKYGRWRDVEVSFRPDGIEF